MRKKITRASYEVWTVQLVERLADFFNLAGWTISVEHDDDVPDDPRLRDAYAHISVNTPYESAHIVFRKQAREDFDKGNTDTLVRCVVHELVHIFINPMADWMEPHLSKTTEPLFENTVENQTQKLAMVLVKNLPPSLIPPI